MSPTTGSGVDYALAWLEKNGSMAGRDGMARFAIPPTPYGSSGVPHPPLGLR